MFDNVASVPSIVIVFEALSIVLLVNVCVPEFVVTVLSIAKVTLSPDTVELIPVPPKNCNVSASVIVEVVELDHLHTT
jgi:hypothetical protein